MSARSTHHLPGDDRLPLYERLKDALVHRVRSGEWKPGDALPREADLAGAYGVALGTLRRAVGDLVDEGLLERRQGSGTFVRRSPFASSMFRFFRLKGVEGTAIHPEGRLLARSVSEAPPEAAQALGLANGAPCIRLSRLRLAGGEPLLAEEIILPLEPFRAFLDVRDEDMGPLLYPLYAERCGQVIARAEEVLTFGSCPAPQARLLRLKPGAPVIVIERVAVGFDGEPKEWRRSYGPAERFHYRAEIR